jgi:hypothetical protein
VVKLYELRLQDGRSILLEQLFQYHTYRGVLVGHPSSEDNKELIDAAVRHAEEKLWRDGRPLLLEPVERAVQLPEATRGLYHYRPMELPSVVCLAIFWSYATGRDPGEDYSYLKVVWFQDELALPVDPQVEEYLRGMDWNRLATDATY